MKIGSGTNVPGVAAPAKPASGQKTDGKPDKGTAGARAIHDTVEIMGIPSDELTPKVQTAVTELMGEVDRLRNDLAVANIRIRELEELADLDTLLPIANRRAFVRELNRMISYAERYGTPSTLVYIDMNDLKKINDDLGHEAGDAALKHIARTIKDNIRGSDTLARLGGDEFGVLLAHTDETTGTEKAAQLSAAVQDTPFNHMETQHRLRFAYGVHTFHGNLSAEEALEKADKAMYERKKVMKNAE